MFACPEAVDAEIDAVARELALPQVANLHGVSQATAGRDAEVGEDRMLRVNVGNGEGFFAGTEAALVDFIGVRGAPVVRRWNIDVIGFFRSRCHVPMIRCARAESTRSCCQLFTGCSPVGQLNPSTLDQGRSTIRQRGWHRVCEWPKQHLPNNATSWAVFVRPCLLKTRRKCHRTFIKHPERGRRSSTAFSGTISPYFSENWGGIRFSTWMASLDRAVSMMAAKALHLSPPNLLRRHRRRAVKGFFIASTSRKTEKCSQIWRSRPASM